MSEATSALMGRGASEPSSSRPCLRVAASCVLPAVPKIPQRCHRMTLNSEAVSTCLVLDSVEPYCAQEQGVVPLPFGSPASRRETGTCSRQPDESEPPSAADLASPMPEG